MATRKKAAKKKAAKKSVRKEKAAVAKVLDQLESTAGDVLDEVMQVVSVVTDKVSDVAGDAAGKTMTASEKPVELLKSVLAEVMELGESSVKVIGNKFDDLRASIMESEEEIEKAVRAKVARKKTVKKKAAKKKAAKKKAAR